jgi:hypothetical protein
VAFSWGALIEGMYDKSRSRAASRVRQNSLIRAGFFPKIQITFLSIPIDVRKLFRSEVKICKRIDIGLENHAEQKDF